VRDTGTRWREFELHRQGIEGSCEAIQNMFDVGLDALWVRRCEGSSIVALCGFTRDDGISSCVFAPIDCGEGDIDAIEGMACPLFGESSSGEELDDAVEGTLDCGAAV